MNNVKKGTLEKTVLLAFHLVNNAYQVLYAQNVIRMEKHTLRIRNATLAIRHVRFVMIVDALNVQMHTIQLGKIV